MSVNVLRLFESHEIREARQVTADLKLLVTVAKREQAAAEVELRKKMQEAAEASERMPIAGAIIWRGDDDG